MEGVTVVDHVLLRRLVSILRDRNTSHRVFRETLDDAAMILAYEAMRDAHPEVPIFCAAVDRQLDERGYIRPGLGDAGDRIFGTE